MFKEKNLIKNYDSRDAKELGKINAVDILIIGTIMPFEEFNKKFYKLTIKLLDTKQGSILSSVKGQIEKNPSLDNLFDGASSESKTSPSTIVAAPQPVVVYNTPSKVAEINPCSSQTGSILIKNNFSRSLLFYISSTPIDLNNGFERKYEELTVAGGSEDSLPGLKPGLYYICGVLLRYESQCQWSKKVNVEACKNASVTIDR